MRIYLDTDVLIYWFQSRQEGGATQMHRDVTSWIAEMERAGHDLLLPAPVLTEFLAVRGQGVHRARQQELADHLGVLTMPFDERCALVAGQLWRSMSDHQQMPGEKHAPIKKGLKAMVKADIFIAATAIVGRGDMLVTCNTKDFIGNGEQGIQQAIIRCDHSLRIVRPEPKQMSLT